jgi:hypothetical protein
MASPTIRLVGLRLEAVAREPVTPVDLEVALHPLGELDLHGNGDGLGIVAA